MARSVLLQYFEKVCDIQFLLLLDTVTTCEKNIWKPVSTYSTCKNLHILCKSNFSHVTQLSTNQIASVTTKDINKLKLIIPKSDKQRQLQVEKLEGNFKEAINKYYQLQKVKECYKSIEV